MARIICAPMFKSNGTCNVKVDRLEVAKFE